MDSIFDFHDGNDNGVGIGQQCIKQQGRNDGQIQCQLIIKMLKSNLKSCAVIKTILKMASPHK